MEVTVGSVGVGLVCGAVTFVFPRQHAEPIVAVAAVLPV